MIVYKITNTVNGKAYIGISSRTMKQRWYGHTRDALDEAPTPLHRAMRKYGLEAFEREVLYEADSHAEALVVERGLIAAHRTFAPNGYNVTLGGGGMLGWKFPEAAKRKLSEERQGIEPTCARRKKPVAELLRMAEAGRSKSRYTPETIALAKALMTVGAPTRWISNRFGIERTTVGMIRRGKLWWGLPPTPFDDIAPELIAEAQGAEADQERRQTPNTAVFSAASSKRARAVQSPLTERQVALIKGASLFLREPKEALAERYNVHPSTVGRIVNHSWPDVVPAIPLAYEVLP